MSPGSRRSRSVRALGNAICRLALILIGPCGSDTLPSLQLFVLFVVRHARLFKHKFSYWAWWAILSLTPDAPVPASPGKNAAPPPPRRGVDACQWQVAVRPDHRVSPPDQPGRLGLCDHGRRTGERPAAAMAFRLRPVEHPRPVTQTSHRAIRLVPSNQVSNFHHDQPQTLVDNGGHHARGQACDGPGSLRRYLASGRRSQVS
jgi:hypothetical protein